MFFWDLVREYSLQLAVSQKVSPKPSMCYTHTWMFFVTVVDTSQHMTLPTRRDIPTSGIHMNWHFTIFQLALNIIFQLWLDNFPYSDFPPVTCANQRLFCHPHWYMEKPGGHGYGLLWCVELGRPHERHRVMAWRVVVEGKLQESGEWNLKKSVLKIQPSHSHAVRCYVFACLLYLRSDSRPPYW